MDFEQSLVYELSAITGLDNKVFPSFAEENIDPPMVVYISSEGEKIMTLAGATDLTELTCEIHIITDNYADLKAFTKQVIDRIRSFFQRQIGQNGVYVRSVSHTEPIEDIDNDTNFHQCSFDIRIRY